MIDTVLEKKERTEMRRALCWNHGIFLKGSNILSYWIIEESKESPN